MNTDCQKLLQPPKQKLRSYLAIKVHSKLMSRPCPSARGPKPPVAPKPRLALEQEDEHSQSCIGNGDVMCSERELEQESESEATPDEADECLEDLVENVDTCAEEAPKLCHEDHENHVEQGQEVDEEERLEEEEEREDGIETEYAVSLNSVEVADVTSDVPDAGHIKESDDLSPPEDTKNLGDTLEGSAECFECDTATEDQIKDDSGDECEKQNQYEEGNKAEEYTSYCSNEAEEHYCNDSGSCVCEPVSECTSEQCENRYTNEENLDFNLPKDEVDEDGFSSQAANCSEPSLGEEYPYDVIGQPDDNSSWQPERATKDQTGRFRFSDETAEEFEPYSVIEVVPADMMSTTDPEVTLSDDECSGEQTNSLAPSGPEGTANQEPNYLSSDDVAEAEDAQAQTSDSGVDQEHLEGKHKERPNSRTGDEYADIEEDGNDSEQVECVSSEDYVEIGDDDESVDMERKSKGKSIRQRSARRGQGLLNQRNSCQPRLRLCNITVPVDLDLGRTPELTNRVVFAHTTEAFEEDIEDLDCHIVPFFEDTDSESDEHIYEEAGFDSEGENIISLDRKSIVTRSRSLSGKVPGYVPETVPEEPGTENQTNDYYTVALDQNGDPQKYTDHSETIRKIPALKPRHFLLYPRSYSVEGRDLPFAAHLESDHSPREDDRLKRKDDTLSLPCVITSSGSFSQRSHQSSSGVSTPTSLVDIPPPFELAYITKRPVTKSSPSLLIQHESNDKPKKKKSSFKRFLALKFRKKSESKGHGDGSVRSSRSSSESSHHGPVRVLEMDRRSTSSSPQPQSRMVIQQRSPELPATFVLYKDRQRRKGAPKTYSSRGISRVESFEDRSRPPFMPLPLTKPRSISFPSADTSDYENIPAMSSDYENIQIPPGRPTRAVTITEFFDDANRTVASSNENDGYVDMNSFAGIENKPQTTEQETESAYTEPFPVCPAPAGLSAEEDHGRTSEEEEGCADHGYDRQIDGRSRAFYVAKELVDSEREHVKALKVLQEDFRTAVSAAVGEDGGPALEEDTLGEILSTLPQAYELHSSVLAELESRLNQWEESQRVVDVILTRRAEFAVFSTYISEYDRSMALLEESCKQYPAFGDIVKQFERSSDGRPVPLKHQLLQVIVRALQYRMLLTDYLNNLSPDSKEYEDTQAALVIVSELADQANERLKQGENLLRLVHIEYSVKGKRDLLQPGRVFVKEGTLMKVSRKSRQPRHLFLMNDVMLYTYPQQDGKYRLKNTLYLSGMKVSKPVVENVLNTLRIEVSDITITLSASSCGEREDWFHTLSRAIADHAAGLNTFGSSSEAREKLWMSLGEAAPILVPVSHVMMCMNCTSDFSLTLRRHHCNACGKVVCRSCSRNRYPLKYLKDRMAKVCDHCYAELRRKGGNVPGVCGNVSPRSHRASRPLSAVFQSLQPPSLWKSRKSTSPLTQVSVGAEGSTMSGSLQRRKKSKRKWKRLWFLLKDKVLYTFKAREDKVASESLPLQGFTVKLSERCEGEESDSVFQLYHKKTLYYTFRADDQHTARRWVNAMEEATVL
ncbi:FYVE, RhoGEF and PH domain-containing protein 5 isoform X2 [Chanos chanos]|uniref:FYVE, RhoGEF and PH domain-containing protein 5 isoform X2 n=1 Tax=Chanos chanos TaxID=29144 RepID=A0A6J2VK88_CHACN|nr:FYVE, RhoGEF and PH domain-containing protein 5-like isoform X2 [Chanos chanos]